MLVLSRDCDSLIRIGPDIKIKVLSIRKQRVKIGVEAPSSVRIWRDEIAPPGEDEDENCADNQPASPAAGAGSQFPVLLIEDDPDQAELISRALAVSNLPSVTVARSGQEAIDILFRENGSKRHFVPSLILLDLKLPDVSGLDVLRRVRDADWLSVVPVVVLTAQHSDELVKASMEAGANAFVAKALRFDEFVQSIGRIAAFWSHDNCGRAASVRQSV